MSGLVSIIIPIYNVSNYLKECLNSVVRQTYSNIQVILINDGSTDNSLEIANEYLLNDKRVEIHTYINQGLGAARNHGLEFVKGEYVFFLDSDDYLDLNAIKNLIEIAKNNQSNIVVGDAIYFNKKYYRYIKYGLSLNDVFISAWGKLYKTSIWKQYKFPEGVVFEDTSIIPIIMYQTDRVEKLNKPVYFYREQRLDSLSNSENYYKNKDLFKVLNLLNENLQFYRPTFVRKLTNQEIELFFYRELIDVGILENSRRILDNNQRKSYVDEAFSILNKLYPKWKYNKLIKFYYNHYYIHLLFVKLNQYHLFKLDKILLKVKNLIKIIYSKFHKLLYCYKQGK